jgi:hypothetical protein
MPVHFNICHFSTMDKKDTRRMSALTRVKKGNLIEGPRR